MSMSATLMADLVSRADQRRLAPGKLSANVAHAPGWIQRMIPGPVNNWDIEVTTQL